MKRAIALFLPAVLAVACREPAPQPSAQPDRPLRILLGIEPSTLDPHVPFDDVSSVVLDNVFESLVRIDRSLRLTSSLALRWINPDDRTWRFSLDPEARFPDGSRLKASDVKFSLERVRSVSGSQIMGFVRHIVSVTVVDQHTVDVRTDTPIAILNSLAFIPIMSEKHVAEAGAKVSEQPFGTGPYRLVQWEKGKSIVLEANGRHRRKPSIKRVEFIIATEDKDMLAALKTVKPELGAFVRWSLRDEIEKVKPPNQRLVNAEGLGVYYVQFNLSPQIPGRRGRNPLADRRVRRALALATDTGEFVRDAIGGRSRSTTQLVVPQVFGFDPSIPAPAYDPAAARKLLAEAGQPSLEVPLLVLQDRPHSVDDALIRQWAKAGIKGTLQEATPEKHDRALEAGEFSASVQGFACTSADTSEILTSILHTRAPGRGDGAFNFGGFSNPEIDSIADENLKVFDPRRRLEMLQHSLRIASEEVPLLTLFVADDLYLISRDLRWEPPVHGVVDVSEMSFASPQPAAR